MEENTTYKEQVLKKIRKALMHKSPQALSANIDFENEVFAIPDDLPEVIFAQHFTENGGRFIYCEDNAVLIDNLELLMKDEPEAEYKILCQEPVVQELLNLAGIPFTADPLTGAGMVVTGCENLISRTGSILVSSMQGIALKGVMRVARHVVIAFASQLTRDLKEALQQTRNRYNGNLPAMVSVFTLAMHRPAKDIRQYYVFFMDDLPA